MGRSEKNAVGNNKFPDLNMTRYPAVIDSRANNVNMRGFINLGEAGAGEKPDINYAEHVNALTDGLMSVERVLGINPQGTKPDVVTRLDDLDKHNHDERYGGPGWILSQTLVGHTHNGQPGHPSKINLVSEVQGLLAKTSIDLSATGLTGADIRISSGSATKIADAVNDKLSTSQGGTVQKNLEVKGQFMGRTHREWSALDEAGSVEVTTAADTSTRSNSIKRTTGKGNEAWFVNQYLRDFEYGSYVIGVRFRTNVRLDEPVAYIALNTKNGTTWNYDQREWIRGTDFDAVNKWQMFYFVVNVEGVGVDSFPNIRIGRAPTANDATIDFDNAYIIPTHPAVFDR